MSRLTLRLPETLHQQLVNLAEGEGVSLNQYIVYALTRQVSSPYTIQVIAKADRDQQRQNFVNLLAQLGKTETAEIEEVLSHREVVEPEADLSTDVVSRIKMKMQNQK